MRPTYIIASLSIYQLVIQLQFHNQIKVINNPMRIFSKALTRPLLYAASTAKQPVGDVYTWNDSVPTKVDLPEKAKRVSLGQNHNCIVGESGNLYTYGSNKYGQLGHGDKTDLKTPKLVDYFVQKKLKVKQALSGENHTIVLTENHQVYTFGHGGKRSNFFMNLFVSKASPLGHGNQQSVSKPKRVKFFEKMSVERITAGSLFNFAIDEKGRIYYWGCGEYGVAGDAGTKNCNVPETIQYFEYLEQQMKITLKKIKSCGTFSMALMTDGLLYGWGSNHAGQIGIKNQIGIQLHEMVNYPHPVIREGYEDKKVKNFDVSENMTVFQLDNNQLWWCGKHVAFKPERITFQQQDKVKLFAAGFKSFAVVTETNNIYTLGKFVPGKGEEDIKTGFVKIAGSQVFKGEIVGIGGEYNSKYALIA